MKPRFVYYFCTIVLILIGLVIYYEPRRITGGQDTSADSEVTFRAEPYSFFLKYPVLLEITAFSFSLYLLIIYFLGGYLFQKYGLLLLGIKISRIWCAIIVSGILSIGHLPLRLLPWKVEFPMILFTQEIPFSDVLFYPSNYPAIHIGTYLSDLGNERANEAYWRRSFTPAGRDKVLADKNFKIDMMQPGEPQNNKWHIEWLPKL